jgi:DNA replication protein DnaC
MSTLINLFGGPGIGKSSIAAGITYKLKKEHITCDNPYEFPKLLAWDQNLPAIKDQLYVLGNQHRGIAKAYGKVDYIVIDSPILFSLIYKNYYNTGYPAEFYSSAFDQMVIDLHHKYKSLNILLERNEDSVHSVEERYQTLNESLDLDRYIKSTLDNNKVDYHTVKVGKKTIKKILKLLLN